MPHNTTWRTLGVSSPPSHHVRRRPLPRPGPRVILALALLIAAPSWAHENPGYSHDADNGARNPDWMSSVDGSLPLSALSLPGTHDSLSFYGGDIPQTQSMPLAMQLEAGIRVLDIRCRHIGDSFSIHHGSIYQRARFGSGVMEPVIDFLEAHPRETVLMRVADEYDPADNTRSFAATFDWYMGLYGHAVWKPTSTNPTLDEVRGKIVILEQFPGHEGKWGLNYRASDQQDAYELTTNWDLYDKWEKIKAQLINANTSNRDGFFINYLSGSTGSFPYFVASGHSSPGTSAPRLATGLTTPGSPNAYPDFPRVNCLLSICTIAFEGTNTLTYDYIRAGQVEFTGMIMADFPGAGLIQAIIALNLAPTPAAGPGGSPPRRPGAEAVRRATGARDRPPERATPDESGDAPPAERNPRRPRP